ncbi:MAG: efflux RND transporter permease subunit [Rhizobiales bacterium]|nr:efflux RND transporter permease subunit [Hyphomicrobiales bacterium]
MSTNENANNKNSESKTNLVSIFVRHSTAANLLMAIMVMMGLYAVSKINVQFFPTVEVPIINVSVHWPGASSEDVEKNILDSLEPELRFLDDVEEVNSYAREGAGTISLEFYANADMQKAQSDVEQAIAGVTTLPEDSEEPIINRVTFYENVAKLAISGPFSEETVKAYAKQIRDGLLNNGIDRVTLSGVRDEEIWIEIKEEELRRLNLSLSTIAERIRLETRDLPSGTIEGGLEVQLRALAERRTPEELAKIEIVSLSSGEKIYLKDIAKIHTQFDKDGKIGIISGNRAIQLSIKRAVSSNTLKTMESFYAYVEKIKPTLPPSLKLNVYDVRGESVKQRLGILIENGLQGLVLVLIVLFIFLNWRIAFWVAAGIPVALMATVLVMWLSGQTINMISMFALIMMIGIIVDDAIVVAEDTATRQSMGIGPRRAAEQGALRMLKPVSAATLTTMAAFFPIFLIQGRLGDFMSAIPLVVMAVLIASIVECFLILPGHLRHAATSGNMEERGRFRAKFDDGLEAFRDGPYRRFVEFCYDWRYSFVALTVLTLIISMGLIAGGRVGFQFFPSPEAEKVTAKINFVPGTPNEEQVRILKLIETDLKAVEARLTKDKNEKLIVAVYGLQGKSGRAQGDSLAEVNVNLTPSEDRTIRTRAFIREWKKSAPKIPAIERFAIGGKRVGPPGADIDIRLKGADVNTLKKAADDLKLALAGVSGVSNVDDDLPYGKPEWIIEVTPRGTSLGLTAQSVGTQIRNSFEGAIATRFARGDEEITVRVKRKHDLDGIEALRSIYLITPDNQRVPLPEVVTLREKPGFSVIQRRDGARTVSVTADIDPKLTEVATVIEQLKIEALPKAEEKYSISYSLAGRAEDRAKSFADLKLGALLALVLIYIILAWVFESYAKPFAVMAIIPFGAVGAILGHMVMGTALTILSFIGLLGLSGILVNDSIILVTEVKNRLDRGEVLHEAAIGASQDRLRAVLLTSLTTIGGLLPLLFETSRQAQFLMPMAITMVFGLAAATILVLVLVPVMVGIGGDIGNIAKWYMRLGTKPTSPEPAE